MKRALAFFFALHLAAPMALPAQEALRAPATEAFVLREPDMDWVESTLAGMSLEEKVGQLILSTAHRQGERQIENYHVGGFGFLGNNQRAEDIVATVNRLQEVSRHPLWFAIDSEAGLGARVGDATVFPPLMAFGAADDEELAADCGRITAWESRALGIQIAWGPVVDVNVEATNPIISTRAFGDDPEQVSRLAAAFLRGAREGGALTTLKHFPGHGATSADSHEVLPTVDLSEDVLRAVHLRPYFSLAGPDTAADFIMTAHIWYPHVDEEKPWPATLSANFNRRILREEMDYRGLLISDAYNMGGIRRAVPEPGERAVLGLEAGLDIVLAPTEMGRTVEAIMEALASGRLDERQITDSARRVLIAKSRAGLPEASRVDPEMWRGVLGHESHRAVVRRIAEKAVTRIPSSEGNSSFVVAPDDNLLLVVLEPRQMMFYRFPSDTFTEALAGEVTTASIWRAPQRLSHAEEEQLVLAAAHADKLVVASYDWTRISSPRQAECVQRLADLDVPMALVLFGAPYQAIPFTGADEVLVGYSTVPEMQEVMADVLLGRRDAPGKLPVEM